MNYKKDARGLLIATLISAGLGLVSCDDTNPFERINNFDQQPMLINYADSLIVPGYAALKQETDKLATEIEALLANPTEEMLQNARQQLKEARLSWQQVAMYQFGPAESYGLTAALNIYPADKLQIDQNIASGNYDLSAISNQDARGFQAMEYLLYGDGQTNEELLAALVDNRAQYLSDVLAAMRVAVNQTAEDWSGSVATYRDEFVSEDAVGVDIGSSVGKMVNGFIRDLERNTRDGKVGIPVGIRSLGNPILGAVESPFANYSVVLLLANLNAFKQMFNGGAGTGFDDYLRGIGAATTGNESLDVRINAQFDKAIAAASQLSDPLQSTIETDKAKVELVFAELQVLVTLLKTDFASSIGVVISYQDTDGD